MKIVIKKIIKEKNNINKIEEKDDNEDEINIKIDNNKDNDYLNVDQNLSFNLYMKINKLNSKKDILLKEKGLQAPKLNKSFVSPQINNIYDINNFTSNCICQKNDMNILEEAFNRATLLSLSFNESYLLSNSNNINSNKNALNGLMLNDSYIFQFEVSSLLPQNNKFLKIKVGFKLEYINSKDINFLIDAHAINEENMNYKIGSLGDTLKLQKNLKILKNTGIVYAIINITKGKFFIIGKKEIKIRKKNLFLGRNNAEIFYLQNFVPISTSSLKNIKPTFHMDKKNIKFFEIKFNDKKLK